jgi:hypothetical protein
MVAWTLGLYIYPYYRVHSGYSAVLGCISVSNIAQ